MMSDVLPKALEDSTNVVPYSELIIELAGGSGVLDIWTENKYEKVSDTKILCRPGVTLRH